MSDVWVPNLGGTHFWDCSGGGCDATTLTESSWESEPNPLYVYAPQYAPVNPADYGGAQYGEQLWITGAASDALSDLMGPDDECCGYDSSYSGGCGKCVLVRNPSAVNADWTAVVMKKNRCPPWTNGCESGNVHLDLAIPGYDNLQWSTANICGSSSATYLTQDQSTVCGSWWDSASSTINGCDCSSMPSSTDEEKIIKRGCELFSAWGWTSGDPSLDYQIVDCPTNFVSMIKNSFASDGVQDAVFPVDPQPIVFPTEQNVTVQTTTAESTTTVQTTTISEPVQEGIPDISYCTWSGVCLENGEGGSDWCDWDESNCDSCGGQWCLGWDLIDSTEASNAAQSTTTEQTVTVQATTADSTTTVQTTTISEPTTTVQITTTTEPTTTIHSTTKSTTAGKELTTTSNHVDTVDGHNEILDAISDVSSDVTALTAIAESLQAAIDASDCTTVTTSNAQSSTIAATSLMDLRFSSKADFENDWTLVTDSGKWNYNDANEAMMIRTGTDGSATYAYKFVSNSQSFQFFMISATGKGNQLYGGDGVCRFEVSATAGTSWHNQPVLLLETSSISGSDTLVFTSGDEDLVVRWIVEGNSGNEKCYLQNVRVQGLGGMKVTTSYPLENRRLRG